MKVGVLFLGLSGCTANTFVTSVTADKQSEVGISGCVTDRFCFPSLGLPRTRDLVCGGWDVVAGSALDHAMRYGIVPDKVLSDRARAELRSLEPMPGWAGRQDPPPRDGQAFTIDGSLSDGEQKIRSDIREFRRRQAVDEVVVVLLGPPLSTGDDEVRSLPTAESIADAISSDRRDLITSAMLYAYCGIVEGCGVVDFTPNVTISQPAFDELARRHRVPLAGRDGSTGQTMLKGVLAHLFWMRGLEIDGWYSTNILGNNDGLVLGMSAHRVTKLHDKRALLTERFGLPPARHVVDISFFPPRGDNKEAWDSIDVKTWFGLTIALKINWLGRDSVLAGPLLLDLVRLMAFEVSRRSPGIQSQLGFYFKYPLGHSAMQTPVESFSSLIEHYTRLDEGRDS